MNGRNVQATDRAFASSFPAWKPQERSAMLAEAIRDASRTQSRRKSAFALHRETHHARFGRCYHPHTKCRQYCSRATTAERARHDERHESKIRANLRTMSGSGDIQRISLERRRPGRSPRYDVHRRLHYGQAALTPPLPLRESVWFVLMRAAPQVSVMHVHRFTLAPPVSGTQPIPRIV